MRFTPLKIAGAWLIEPELHCDERGIFRRHFCAEEMLAHGCNPHVAQCNVSENFLKGTLRGFHFQRAPHQEAKTLSVFDGTAYFVIADLRPDSQTYLGSVAVDLSAGDRMACHVPIGCGVAFLTLTAGVRIHYYVSHPYTPAAEWGIRWNDPVLGIKWPVEPQVISERDRSFEDYRP